MEVDDGGESLLGLRPAWREETEGQAAEWRLEAAARGAPAAKGGLCARGRGWGPVGGKVSAVKSRRRVGLNVRDRGRERKLLCCFIGYPDMCVG
jgi:hypothetical protein